MSNYMKRLLAPLSIALGFAGVSLAGFFISAHAAQGMAPEDGSLFDLAQPIFDHVMKGHYIAATALALIVAVAALKRYSGNGALGKFVHSDPGGVVTTFAMSFLGAVLTAAVATGSGWSGLSLEVLKVSSFVGLTAIGGYVGIKKFVLPLLKPYMDKAPAWMQKIFGLVMWMFDRKLGTAQAEADAAKAGQGAVDAKPSTGVAGVIGKPTDVK